LSRHGIGAGGGLNGLNNTPSSPSSSSTAHNADFIARAIEVNEQILRDCPALPISPFECVRDERMRKIAAASGYTALLQRLDNPHPADPVSQRWLHYCSIENKNHSSGRVVMMLGNSFASRTIRAVIDALEVGGLTIGRRG